jgi:hypothetical protein
MQDFEETFMRLKPGVMRSKSTREISIGALNQLQLKADIVQTIEYEPGCLNDDRVARSSSLLSSRNFIVFDKEEGVVRFALTSKIEPLEGVDDPCKTLRCDRNSFCVPGIQGGGSKCECNPGFTPYGANECADINECATGDHNCSPNGECLNVEGTFRCQCLTGFIGNGVECIEEISCEDLDCDANAECVQGSYGQAECKCLNGFSGNGLNCIIVPSQLSLTGVSEPEEIMLEPDNYPDIVASVSDIGPLIEHIYEVRNIGAQTVGNVEVQVSWPLKDASGIDITYLPETPEIVVITSPSGAQFSKPCSMASDEDINPRRLPSRKKRQTAADYAGEEFDENEDYYADNVGMVVENQEGELTPYEQSIMAQYDNVYDYSHFDHLATEKEVANDTEQHSIILPEETSNNDTLLERVIFDVSKEGHISFICSVNLAPQVVWNIPSLYITCICIT